MLLVHPVSEAGHRYYLAAVPDESSGVWLGSGAPLLGLAGEVDGVHLARILSGRHPHDDDALVVRRSNRLAGLDLLFAAPKSVSIAHGLADQTFASALAGAHDRAVRAALGYLERQACAVRQGPTLRAPGAGIVSATFRHRTSRANDPHLHTHAVTANLSAGPSGRWSALHTPLLFVEARTAGALYQALLRHEVAALGLGWARAGERWELDGVQRLAIDAFSQRRAQVLAAIAESAVAIRPPKVAVDYSLLHEQWRRRADDLGLKALRPVQMSRAPDPDMTRILDGLGDVFGRSEVVRVLCERLPHGASAVTIEGLADEALRSRAAVPLPPHVGVGRLDGPAGPRQRFTSLAVAERRAELMTALPAIVTGSLWERYETLDRLRAAAEAEGRAVVALAPGPMAAIDLEDATGIATAVVRGERHRLVLPSGSLLVVADADRLRAAVLTELVAEARSRNVEVVLAGDASERGPLPSAFAALATKAPRAEAVRRTEPQAAATVEVPRGTLTVATSTSLIRSTLVADWSVCVAKGHRAVMVGRRPSDVDALVAIAGESGSAVTVGEAWRHADCDQFVLGSRLPFVHGGVRGSSHRYVVHGPCRIVPVPRFERGAALTSTSMQDEVRAGTRVAALALAAQSAPEPWLRNGLGSAPADLGERLRWREALTAVVVYRDRWQIEDRSNALGAESRDLAQRIDRRRVEGEVARALPDRAIALTFALEGPGLCR